MECTGKHILQPLNRALILYVHIYKHKWQTLILYLPSPKLVVFHFHSFTVLVFISLSLSLSKPPPQPRHPTSQNQYPYGPYHSSSLIFATRWQLATPMAERKLPSIYYCFFRFIDFVAASVARPLPMDACSVCISWFNNSFHVGGPSQFGYQIVFVLLPISIKLELGS